LPPCALDAPVPEDGVALPRVHAFLPDSVQPHMEVSKVHGGGPGCRVWMARSITAAQFSMRGVASDVMPSQ
jgi:hypothetical protein